MGVGEGAADSAAAEGAGLTETPGLGPGLGLSAAGFLCLLRCGVGYGTGVAMTTGAGFGFGGIPKNRSMNDCFSTGEGAALGFAFVWGVGVGDPIWAAPQMLSAAQSASRGKSSLFIRIE